MLHEAGYATGAFGKWHLGLDWHWRNGSVLDGFGPDGPTTLTPDADFGAEIDYAKPFSGGPLQLGFDRFFGIAGSLDMPPYCFLDQNRTVGIPDTAKDVSATGQRRGLTVADWRDDEVDLRVTAEAVGWLEQQAQADRPFFLYLTPAAPHRPCVPPEFVQGRSAAGRRGDAVCLVDWMVGQLVDALDRSGQADNTLIIVTSDNGAPLIPADGDVETHRPNGPWRGQKADLWDGGHREPFIARWQGRIPAGAIRDDLVCLVDMLPTVAAATGVAVPAGAAEDAVNILPVLRDETESTAGRAIVHHSLGGGFSLRDNQWKAIFSTGSGRGFSKPVGELCDATHADGQLYDVRADPAEQHNLWSARPDVVAAQYQRLKEICRDPESGLAFDIPLSVA
jgi:arylsulfatase A-like enzyme